MSKNKVDSSTEARASIEYALHTRTAPHGTVLAKVEDVVKSNGAKLWHHVKKRPSLGVTLVGGLGLAVAMAVGVGELTIGIIAGYGAYQVLREGVPPKIASQEVIHAIEKL